MQATLQRSMPPGDLSRRAGGRETGDVEIDVPEVVRRKAVLAGAEDWLRSLPELVAALERDWSITVAAAFPDSTEAYVAAATTAAGQPAVLKLIVPRDGDAARHEITVLRLADGQGCVRLLRDDPDRAALLLERLGPSLHEFALPMRQRHEILCDLAVRVWRPAADSGLPTGADKGRWLAGFVAATWERLHRPCSEYAVEHALTCAARRVAAYDLRRARLVHGDVHQWNALRSPDGFALVDPDGLLAEPEYDLGIVMREDPVELVRGEPERRATWLAARTGLDAAAIWEWGVVERVSTGLLATSIGLQPIGAQMLHAADVIAQQWNTAERPSGR
jgi:streptomycin 6-kinase